MSYIFISSSHYNNGVFVEHVTYLDKERKKERKKHKHTDRKKEKERSHNHDIGLVHKTA